MPRHIIQPPESSLCGHCCVAMAAGVGVERVIEEIGHEDGTTTKELVAALHALNVPCGGTLLRFSRVKPVLPKRCIVYIHRYGEKGREPRGHWMLSWDGKIYDPGGRWPEGYANWRITSYLEIF